MHLLSKTKWKQVTLRSIETDAAESETEVVRAKYVLGSDGKH